MHGLIFAISISVQDVDNYEGLKVLEKIYKLLLIKKENKKYRKCVK
mgnify:CR=1 FL=1